MLSLPLSLSLPLTHSRAKSLTLAVPPREPVPVQVLRATGKSGTCGRMPSFRGRDDKRYVISDKSSIIDACTYADLPRKRGGQQTNNIQTNMTTSVT
ncbi:hypothetical protein T492DRAFT_978859 [Pavlovales sp. CCMP2436]|nr:hypothetical protein T492DRAFT_978859 [Pavlovales sp. CCMP2436]